MWTWIIMWITLAIILLWILFPLTPFLLAMVGYKTPNDGNSQLAALPWIFMITAPTGLIATVIWIGVAIYLWLYRR